MVRLRVKVGPKGQVIIPKVLREAYRIREGGYAVIEPRDDGILVRGVEEPEEVLKWVRERRKRLGGKVARLGELTEAELEWEFSDEGAC